MPFEIFPNACNYDWHHSYSAQFPDTFELPIHVLVVLNFLFLFVFRWGVK